MTTTLDVRPAGINLQFRPGATRRLVMEWPAGSLAGRTFTSTLGGTLLDVSVVGDTMTVEVPDEVTATFSDVATWLLLEDLGGTPEPVLVGRWNPSDRPRSVVPLTDTVAVLEQDVNVAVTVAGSGPLALELADLPAAALPLDGDELLPALQDGAPVKVTPDQVAGAAVLAIAGVTRDRFRHAEHFESIRTAVTANGAVVADTRLQTSLAGTGAQVAQGQDAFAGELGVADLSKGTTASGRCALVTSATPLFLFAQQLMRVGYRARMPAVSDGTNTYVVHGGMCALDTVTPPNGFLFRSPTAAGNWQAVVRVAGADAAVYDTGVAVDGLFHVFVVEYDPAFGGARWWIDGDPVASDTVNEPAALAPLTNYGVGILGIAGLANRTLELDALAFDMPGVDLHNMP